MPETRRAVYIDEDADEEIARALTALGHNALSTREAGKKGLSDVEQLAFAVRQQRVLITCNRRDLEALHEAWHVCAREWNVSARPLHYGILVIPNERGIAIQVITAALDDKLRSDDDLDDRLWRWRPSLGWQLMKERRWSLQ